MINELARQSSNELNDLAQEAFIRDRMSDMRDTIQLQQREIERLTTEKNIDHLTQVVNRSGFELLIDEEWSKLKRRRHDNPNTARLSLICIDVDDFKIINDSYGHPAGDAALKTVTDAMNARLRENDIIARFGGDEFVIALLDADEDDALGIAVDLVRLVAGTDISYNGRTEFNCTISAGVSSLSDQTNWTELYKQADDALYATKEAGKGHVLSYRQLTQ
ncbi:MAG: GGDEF domain-containing protein [Candidatus Saccharimonadales bacterium]